MRVAVAAAVAAALLVARAAPARAAEYETFIDVDDEEDLRDLLDQGEISQDTFDTLADLLRDGIDLDSADRDAIYTLPNLSYDDVDKILEFRKVSGRIGDPANLVASGVIPQDKYDAIKPFLRVRTAGPVRYATDAMLHARGVFWPTDLAAPAGALQGRLSTLKNLTAGGALLVTTHRLGTVVYDPLRGALTAEAPSVQVHVPKLYVRWDDGDFGVIGGSYRIGFGQRLTFDDTTRYTPNGFVPDDVVLRGTSSVSACKESQGELTDSPCSGAAGDEYAAPDFRWREGLFGVAVGVQNLDAGAGKLQLYGFFSSARRPIYQYELYDPSKCTDPNNDADPSCAAPDVYRTQSDPLAPTSRFSYQTLPDMFREDVVGGNVSWFTGFRTHVGATWYLSSIDWLVDGMQLDFQEFSRYPRGGAFGAVGVDAGLRVLDADVFAEVTRSFDRTPGGGGGFGAILRAVATFHRQELEASVRWYGQDFVNPYARPIAAADETGGQRVRDEAGVRLRYEGMFDKRFTLHGSWDTWVEPSTNTPKTVAYVRSDYLFTRKWAGGLWLAFSDKDLSANGGAMECYDTPFDTSMTGETVACTGQKWLVAAHARFMPTKRLQLSVQAQDALLDDPAYPGSKRQDVSTWLMAVWHATPALRVRVRERFFDQDFADISQLERSSWTYLELTYRYQKQWWGRVRYDLYWYLDDRASTKARSPNPEQWLWLELEGRF